MADIATAVKDLAKACDDAYKAHEGSCSHAVWDVIKAVHDPAQEFRAANELVDWMSTKWVKVKLEDGFLAANRGAVVVGGKKEAGHGHVIVIYPGDKIMNGGYQYYYAKEKKILMMPRKTLYPRCLSTSIANPPWPGAKSCGDKTVWDPWARDDKFELVNFFTPAWPLVE